MLVMVIGRTGELNSNITSPKQYDILKHPTLPLPELMAATWENSKGYLITAEQDVNAKPLLARTTPNASRMTFGMRSLSYASTRLHRALSDQVHACIGRPTRVRGRCAILRSYD